MKTLLEINESPIHGKGVFAIADISVGTEVSRCEVVLLEHDWDLPEGLATIEFPWDETYYAICISGVGSFFNHAKDFNIVVQADFENQQQTFLSNRDIKAGEELCFFYNQGFEDWLNKTSPKH